jgi:RNA 2',3'-cyclic 3'-phosphodiesterase
MRLFVAIELPKEITKELKRLQEKLKPHVTGTFVDEFHLTLKFMGDVDEDKLEDIEEHLSLIKFTPFDLRLSNTGVFPSESYIKVVWVGLKPEDRVKDLQSLVDRALFKFNLKKEDFIAHITLVRVKTVKDKDDFKRVLKSIVPEQLSFKVDNFKLIQSTLTKEKPVYKLRKEFKAD